MKTQLAPGLLIAAPALTDPNFARALVLMCVHNEESALGLVLNRTSGLTVLRVFEDLQLVPQADMGRRDVLLGGPVQPHQGWVLFAEDGPVGQDEIDVGAGLKLSASRTILERIGRGEGPSRYLLLFGYAGWGPGQLETEISEGAWIPAEFDSELVFEAALEKRWDLAIASLGISPAFIGMGSLGGGSGVEA